MLVILVRTTQPVKPVLQTKDIVVCALLDSKVMNVKMVRIFLAAMFCLLVCLFLFTFKHCPAVKNGMY